MRVRDTSDTRAGDIVLLNDLHNGGDDDVVREVLLTQRRDELLCLLME